MSTQGEELLKSIRSMRGFFGDVSQLLMTADGIMSEKSWEPIWASSCLGDMSYHVSFGHKWMPREAWRLYKNTELYPKVIAIVTVFLDDYQREYNLSEPIVSGSYFVFPEEQTEETIKLDYWHTRCLGWCKVNLDGTPDSVDNHKPDWKATYGWEHMEVFGWPLVEITEENMLKQRIIDPLLEMIDAYCGTRDVHK